MAGVLEDVWQSTSSSASSASMGPSIVGASGDAPLGKQEVFQLLLQERRALRSQREALQKDLFLMQHFNATTSWPLEQRAPDVMQAAEVLATQYCSKHGIDPTLPSDDALLALMIKAPPAPTETVTTTTAVVPETIPITPLPEAVEKAPADVLPTLDDSVPALPKTEPTDADEMDITTVPAALLPPATDDVPTSAMNVEATTTEEGTSAPIPVVWQPHGEVVPLTPELSSGSEFVYSSEMAMLRALNTQHHSHMAVARASKQIVFSDDWMSAREERRSTAILQRIDQLRRSGQWSLRQLKRFRAPLREKTHHDYLLDEMAWLAVDFRKERDWKLAMCKFIAEMVCDYHEAEDKYALLIKTEATSRMRKSAVAHGANKKLSSKGGKKSVVQKVDVDADEKMDVDQPATADEDQAVDDNDEDDDSTWTGALLYNIEELKSVADDAWLPPTPPPENEPQYVHDPLDRELFLPITKCFRVMRKRPHDVEARFHPNKRTAPHLPSSRLYNDAVKQPSLFRVDPSSEQASEPGATAPSSAAVAAAGAAAAADPRKPFNQMNQAAAWTPEEDEKLVKAVKIYGTNWTLVSDVLTAAQKYVAVWRRRSPRECSYRYAALDPPGKTSSSATKDEASTEIAAENKLEPPAEDHFLESYTLFSDSTVSSPQRHIAAFESFQNSFYTKTLPNSHKLVTMVPGRPMRKVNLTPHESHGTAISDAGALGKLMSPTEIAQRVREQSGPPGPVVPLNQAHVMNNPTVMSAAQPGSAGYAKIRAPGAPPMSQHPSHQGMLGSQPPQRSVPSMPGGPGPNMGPGPTSGPNIRGPAPITNGLPTTNATAANAAASALNGQRNAPMSAAGTGSPTLGRIAPFQGGMPQQVAMGSQQPVHQQQSSMPTPSNHPGVGARSGGGAMLRPPQVGGNPQQHAQGIKQQSNPAIAAAAAAVINVSRPASMLQQTPSGQQQRPHHQPMQQPQQQQQQHPQQRTLPPAGSPQMSPTLGHANPARPAQGRPQQQGYVQQGQQHIMGSQQQQQLGGAGQIPTSPATRSHSSTTIGGPATPTPTSSAAAAAAVSQVTRTQSPSPAVRPSTPGRPPSAAAAAAIAGASPGRPKPSSPATRPVK